MQIRPMVLEDIDQVVTLENKTWNALNTPASLPVTSKDKLIKDFENGTHYLVIEDNNEILGVLDYHSYYPFPSGRHVVTFGIAISEKTREQGLGRQLIHSFFELAKADDYQKVLIHVLSSNEKACAFYEKLGFKQEAVLKNQFYLNDTYVDDLIYSYYLEDIHAK